MVGGSWRSAAGAVHGRLYPCPLCVVLHHCLALPCEQTILCKLEWWCRPTCACPLSTPNHSKQPPAQHSLLPPFPPSPHIPAHNPHTPCSQPSHTMLATLKPSQPSQAMPDTHTHTHTHVHTHIHTHEHTHTYTHTHHREMQALQRSRSRTPSPTPSPRQLRQQVASLAQAREEGRDVMQLLEQVGGRRAVWCSWSSCNTHSLRGAAWQGACSCLGPAGTCRDVQCAAPHPPTHWSVTAQKGAPVAAALACGLVSSRGDGHSRARLCGMKRAPPPPRPTKGRLSDPTLTAYPPTRGRLFLT